MLFILQIPICSIATTAESHTQRLSDEVSLGREPRQGECHVIVPDANVTIGLRLHTVFRKHRLQVSVAHLKIKINETFRAHESSVNILQQQLLTTLHLRPLIHILLHEGDETKPTSFTSSIAKPLALSCLLHVESPVPSVTLPANPIVDTPPVPCPFPKEFSWDRELM